MACGCTTTGTASCYQIYSSNCILYQGADNANFNICQGKSNVTDVLTAILNAFPTVTNGIPVIDPNSIIPTGITGLCTALSTPLLAFTNPNINNYLQVYGNAICSNTSQINTILSQINAPLTYSNPGCLSLPTSPSQQQVIQATINQLCSVTTQLATLTTEVDGGPTLTPALVTQVNSLISNYVATNITSCANTGRSITKDTNGNNVVQFNAQVPNYCPIPYIGPTSYFDSTGIGLAQYGMCGYYVCNGNNGTPDMRGFTFGGATNLPFTTSTNLNQLVDPVFNNDPDYATSMRSVKGQVKHSLVAAEEGAHVHPISDPQHSHTLNAQSDVKGGHDNSVWVIDVNAAIPGHNVNPDNSGQNNANGVANTFSGKVNPASTGITQTQANTPAGTPHENRQPTIYGCWIIRIPTLTSIDLSNIGNFTSVPTSNGGIPSL